MARPVELTPERLAALVEAFDAGLLRDEAAVHTGVPLRTLFRWLARGELEAEGMFAELYNAAMRSRREVKESARMAGKLRWAKR